MAAVSMVMMAARARPRRGRSLRICLAAVAKGDELVASLVFVIVAAKTKKNRKDLYIVKCHTVRTRP